MSISERKIKSLVGDGFEEIGIVLQKDGKRVTVDKFGRVQWWELDGSGKMVSSHASETSLGTKNKFKPLQPITHVKTGKIYRIMECPKSRKLESTGEAFYEYGDISTGQVWIIAKSEMEDGRFV